MEKEHEHIVTVTVNEIPVEIMGPTTTGLAIKQAAIAQKVNIQLDFVLSEEIGPKKTRIISDNDEVHVHGDAKFLAIPDDDNSGLPLKSEVATAIEELKASFPGCEVEAIPDGSGGARVTMRGMQLGPPFTQDETWVMFDITFQYPYSDIYPHYLRGDLKRLDDKPIVAPLRLVKLNNENVYQLSRRSNKWNASVDTAALKLHKVMHWLRDA